jgi:transposase
MKQSDTAKLPPWERRIIGVDMHPEVFTAAALCGGDAATARVEWVHHRVSSLQLEPWVKQHVRPGDLLVLEASGNSVETVERIERAGGHALILESQKAGQIGKTYCKTDKVDAVKLARIYLSGLATVVWKPDATTRARREIFQRHRKTVQDTTRARNRLKGWFNEHNYRPAPGLRLTTAKALSEVCRGRSWTTLQTLLLTQMFEDLWQAESRRKQLRALMAQEILTDPGLLKLIRLFGICHITAFGLGAIIGDIHRFRTPKQLVAYLGLNPSIHESAGHSHGGACGSHGRGDLRAVLVQAAHSILNHQHSPLHRWGWALCFRRNKKVAAVAIARKLTVACWYLLQGRFSSLEEIDQTLQTKIHKLATVVGRQGIKALGYASLTAFKEEKCKLLLQPT